MLFSGHFKGLDVFLITKIKSVIENCRIRNVEIRPVNGLRTPMEQGLLWSRSRSCDEIKSLIVHLRQKKADFLADCLDISNANTGSFVTNAFPGLSWHQWGLAIDCYWFYNKKIIYDYNKNINGIKGYDIYVDEIKKAGLFSGSGFKKFKDFPHVQTKPLYLSPSNLFSLKEINDFLKKKFS